jgi:hypothetical protein
VPPLSLTKKIRVLSRILRFLSASIDLADLVIHCRYLGRIDTAQWIGNPLVHVEVLLRRLIGRMRGCESKIEEKGHLGVMRVDQSDRVGTKQLCIVTRFVD